ncbi:GNAT family N-acetyltransferase [Plastoroseomonas arctica]|uniref:GNAT family N-acetyltransferase n=1 Tax=Plastoroseomonas arctica TaxID=1509237 RepID=A0AAF1JXC6_9PROT|nr:GNAT family N-acetyltransferase [Plastoroseomonas arctica]MBR0656077.1 GNAT family N-acetyltransferase [Plastoroseomonas arctica]
MTMITAAHLDPADAIPLIAAYGAEMRGLLHGTTHARAEDAAALLDGTLLLGAFADGVPVGFLVMVELPEIVFARRCGQIEDLFILPAHRRRGAARVLLAAAEAEARTRGHSHLRWFVPEADAAAVALYERVASRAAWRGYILRLDADASL